jgi:hypothetical protein
MADAARKRSIVGNKRKSAVGGKAGMNVKSRGASFTDVRKKSEGVGTFEGATNSQARKVLQMFQNDSGPGDNFLEDSVPEVRASVTSATSTANMLKQLNPPIGEGDQKKPMDNSKFLIQQQKRPAWEEEEHPTEDFLERKEQERLRKLRKQRGALFTLSFLMLFHITVAVNFILAWYDRLVDTQEVPIM